jgi:WD40 repeat protein
MLAAGDYAGKIRLWDVVSWKELTVPAQELGQEVNAVAFSPDGKYFAACGGSGNRAWGGVLLWRLHRGQPVQESAVRLSSHSTLSLCFSLDSRLLAWTEEYGSGLRIWDLERSQEYPRPPNAKPLGGRHCLEFANGQDLVFTGFVFPAVCNLVTGQNFAFASEDAKFAGNDQPSSWSGSALIAECPCSGKHALAPRVWDLQSKKLLLILPDQRAQPSSFAWSPNREFLAVGLPGGELSIWNLPKIKAQLDELGLGW